MGAVIKKALQIFAKTVLAEATRRALLAFCRKLRRR